VRSEFPNNQVFSRCKFIVEEIERVQQGREDWHKGILITFGKGMFVTTEGFPNFYQVSCDELDFLVFLTREAPEVLGARMMGGGFGGCTINIVQQEAVHTLIDSVRNNYYKKFNIEVEAYIVQIENGTSLI